MAPNPVREKRDLLYVLGQPAPSELMVRVGISGEIQVRAQDPEGLLPDAVVVLQPPDKFSPQGRKYNLLDFAPVAWWRASKTLSSAVESGWLYVDVQALFDPQSSQPAQVNPSPSDQYILRPPSENFGDLLIFDGARWVSIPNGTTGQTLTINGSSIAEWTNNNPSVEVPVSIVTNVDTSSSTFEITGAYALNADDYTEVKFESLGSVSHGALTGEVVLYNLTDASTVLTHSYTTTSPVNNTSAPLALPSGTKVYEIRIRVLGGLPAPPPDIFFCSWAGFRLLG